MASRSCATASETNLKDSFVEEQSKSSHDSYQPEPMSFLPCVLLNDQRAHRGGSPPHCRMDLGTRSTGTDGKRHNRRQRRLLRAHQCFSVIIDQIHKSNDECRRLELRVGIATRSLAPHSTGGLLQVIVLVHSFCHSFRLSKNTSRAYIDLIQNGLRS